MLLAARALQGVGARWPRRPRWPCSPPSSPRARSGCGPSGSSPRCRPPAAPSASWPGGILTELAVVALGDVRQRADRPRGLVDRPGRAARDRAPSRPLRPGRRADVDGRHDRRRARPRRGGQPTGGRARSPWARSAAGLALLALFVRIETHAEEPILPLRLFANAHADDRQRGPRARLRRDVRDVLLPRPVPPGRRGLLAPAGRHLLPPDARSRCSCRRSSPAGS